ncbi:hypothetical protein [Micromonospora endolithica]|uniref:Uncharacterized protein n=1 Tax=Micromonospora endolithica TaxID=230091 RepID=A0A3A9ZDT8_9ACTN|nr:hypothetical protein [Micromonospora endolithica]RKN46315.1 hypothetical protein D7223_15470 [Micromonospora endolithica]TWJ24952.1 hypothetical protein JD76_05112 [Micromonospora endolithica]
MRLRPLLLAAAAGLAAAHVLGILAGDPLLRYAEILALLLLLGHALLGELPAPRWVVPTGDGDRRHLGTAVSLPVALGLAAVGLAAVLVRRGRRSAATGAVLLAVTALAYVDTALAAVPLPVYVGHESAVLTGAARLSSGVSSPLPALTAATELAADTLDHAV